MTHQNKLGFIDFAPILGIVSFIGLYVFSSTLYPGGSQADLNSEGFNWIHNYWCNLMNEKAMNGQWNPARPYSVMGMVTLCVSLMIFFIQFANTFSKNKLWRQLIKVNGVLSMTFGILISTKHHDVMTMISSVFGLIVVIGIIREIYQSELSFYKISGVLCILLLGVNNYIYYSQHHIQTLPLIQKITFVIIIIWIVGLNYELIKRK